MYVTGLNLVYTGYEVKYYILLIRYILKFQTNSTQCAVKRAAAGIPTW
jgi:hypothetical protein